MAKREKPIEKKIEEVEIKRKTSAKKTSTPKKKATNEKKATKDKVDTPKEIKDISYSNKTSIKSKIVSQSNLEKTISNFDDELDSTLPVIKKSFRFINDQKIKERLENRLDYLLNKFTLVKSKSKDKNRYETVQILNDLNIQFNNLITKIKAEASK
jgi:hypothetical protein